MVEVRIRTAGPIDAAALDAVLRRLAADLGDAYRSDADVLAAAAFGPEPAFRAALAEAGGGIVGLALWSPVFSTIRGTAGIYVSDLWVAASRRSERPGFSDPGQERVLVLDRSVFDSFKEQA